MSKLSVAKNAPLKSQVLNQHVLSYKEIKAKLAFLENELKPHKEAIEDACAQTVDGVIITGEYKITLTIAQRESLKLKDAKAVLGDKLNPFISSSTYTILRVV